MITYVHGELEVKQTGRKAEKPLPGGKNQKMILVEITPVSENDGTWKKWVNPQHLFSIINTDSNSVALDEKVSPTDMHGLQAKH